MLKITGPSSSPATLAVASSALGALSTSQAVRFLQGVPSSEIEAVGKGRMAVSGVVATVFGSTGFLGRYVVEKLGAIGSQCILPFRGDELEWRHLKPLGDLGMIVPKRFNPRDINSLESMIKGSNLVVNLMGADYETRNFSFKDVHTTLPRLIAEICAETPSVERLVHVSSLGASLTSKNAFYKSKAEGEVEVMKAFPAATIIRPATLVGHEDRFLNEMGFASKLFRCIPIVDGGKARRAPLFVMDAAQGIFRAIESIDGVGETFELYGPDTVTMETLAYLAYETMKRDPNVVNIPGFAASLTGKFLESLPTKRYSAEKVQRATIDELPTGAALTLEDLGVVPMTLPQMAHIVLRRYRDYYLAGEPIENQREIMDRVAQRVSSA